MSYPFEKIKNHYEDHLWKIFKASEKVKYRWTNPYTDELRWEEMFTPIEESTWNSIRSFGKCPLYPQYPVRKYFVDFGNPVVKVALECDGLLYHADKRKDQVRDKVLLDAGWVVYRVGGADCNRVFDKIEELKEYNDYTDEEKYQILDEWYSTTVDGVIRAIAIFHMGLKEHFYHEQEVDLAFKCLTKRISIDDDMLAEVYERLTREADIEEDEVKRKALDIWKYGRKRIIP